MAAGQDYWWVTLGAVLGHAVCTSVAVIGGRAIAGRVSLKVVTVGGAVALPGLRRRLHGRGFLHLTFFLSPSPDDESTSVWLSPDLHTPPAVPTGACLPCL